MRAIADTWFTVQFCPLSWVKDRGLISFCQLPYVFVPQSKRIVHSISIARSFCYLGSKRKGSIVLNPGSPDLKASALTTGPHCLLRRSLDCSAFALLKWAAWTLRTRFVYITWCAQEILRHTSWMEKFRESCTIPPMHFKRVVVWYLADECEQIQ